MRLLIIGPPGSGKGTQGQRLAARFGIPAISTGDIFRANMAEGTPLGILAQSYVDAGKYVPDEVTNNMVRARLSEPDVEEGFLLDGYPRTSAQVAELDDMLASDGAELDAVVELTADEDEIVTRLLHRAREQGRADDTEATIRTRQGVYQAQTAPLTSIYAERGVLIRVDGVGEVDDVTNRLLNALDAVAI